MRAIFTRLIVVLLLSFIAMTAQGQGAFPAQTEMPDLSQAHQCLQQGKYLQALVKLEKLDATNSIVRQELATTRSFVGDTAGAQAAMDLAETGTGVADPEALVQIEKATRPDALDAIVAEAKDRQIVILNEAHHVPEHRAFALRLAVRLRELGFEYLAVETLSPSTKKLVERGFPIRWSGYYSQEPVFGDFVRQSLRLGYKPVGYEAIAIPGVEADPTDQINQRESAQCQNLMRQIFSKNPQARVFIYVGYSHATEDTQTLPDGREEAWLAARLKEATGLDPLTIDQTIQTERSTIENSTELWRLAQTNGLLAQPTVFQNEDQSFLVGGHYAGKVDMQVFHPATKLVRGRPDWLKSLPGRNAVEIPSEIAAMKTRVLVQAYLAIETEDAVPVDQVILHPDSPAPVLILPDGEFRLVVQDESGNSKTERSITVAAATK